MVSSIINVTSTLLPVLTILIALSLFFFLLTGCLLLRSFRYRLPTLRARLLVSYVIRYEYTTCVTVRILYKISSLVSIFFKILDVRPCDTSRAIYVSRGIIKIDDSPSYR